jgi:glycerate 2-kinase
MKVLIAPNALKGSLSSKDAARVMARALPKDWEAILCPIADGGDGTLECLVDATGGAYYSAMVTGPLPSVKVRARWGRLGTSNTAVVEMAEASGLRLLSADQRSASTTITLGVGELILSALDAGFRTILVGLGGSATNDGGTGCAKALGARFLDAQGGDVPPGGIHLSTLHSMNLANIDGRIAQSNFIGLADVTSPLVGPLGATHMYGRQKCASDKEIGTLEEAMNHYADIVRDSFRRDIASLSGSGAAGGLGFGLVAFCGATIVSGIDRILDLVQFDELLCNCDMVLTAEGTIDEQTSYGKGIAGVARHAATMNKPVHAFAGRVKGDPSALCRQLNINSIHQITPQFVTEKEAFSRAKDMLGLKIQEFVAGFE